MADKSSLFQGTYPATRLRRNRRKPWIREMVAESNLSTQDLIWTVFVKGGKNEREQVLSMPGVERLSVDVLVEKAKEAFSLGIPAIAIFPKTPLELKNPEGDEALNPNNLVCTAVRSIKKHVPDLGVICDVALDPYTSHGQDGLIRNNDKICGGYHEGRARSARRKRLGPGGGRAPARVVVLVPHRMARG